MSLNTMIKLGCYPGIELSFCNKFLIWQVLVIFVIIL